MDLDIILPCMIGLAVIYEVVMCVKSCCYNMSKKRARKKIVKDMEKLDELREVISDQEYLDRSNKLQEKYNDFYL